MATFRKRGPYQWQAQIRRAGYDPVSKTFQTRSDAEEWAREIEREMDRGLYLPRSASEKTTIGDLCQSWKESVLPGKRSEKTHFNILLKNAEQRFGKRAVATITTADVADWRDERLKAVSPSTVRKEMFFLATLIDYGISNRGLVLAGNPARTATRPAEPHHRERRLVGDEEKRLLGAAKASETADHMIPLITMALETGARLGELLALRWDEVDLRKRVATIRGKEIDGKRQLKNTELLRYAPLSPPAIAALRAMKKPKAGGRIFSRWARADSFSKTFARLCATAKITDFHFHDLRHEFASRMAPKVQMQILMKLLGHKSPAMTARYYNQTHDDVSKLAKELYGATTQSRPAVGSARHRASGVLRGSRLE